MAITIAQAKTDYIWRGDQFIALHSIGGYDIVEFWNKPADNIADKTRERRFGVYVDGARKSECFYSLDEALAGCIAIRHEGMNHHADGYFIRMLGIISKPDKEEIAA